MSSLALVSTLALVAVGTTSPETSPQARKILKKVQKYYDSTKDYSAKFVQRYTRVALSRTTESRGQVLIKKPGRMYWYYERPEVKYFIANGKSLWIYEPEEAQAIFRPNFEANRLSDSVRFLWGEGNLGQSFHARVIPPGQVGAKKGTPVLELIPRRDAQFERLVIILDRETHRVEESIIHQTGGDRNHFIFREATINRGLHDGIFEFEVPAGVEVIRQP